MMMVVMVVHTGTWMLALGGALQVLMRVAAALDLGLAGLSLRALLAGRTLFFLSRFFRHCTIPSPIGCRPERATPGWLGANPRA